MNRIYYLLGVFNLLYTCTIAQSYEDYLGFGHTNGLVVYTSDAPVDSLSGAVTLDGLSSDGQVSLTDASRFLAQSSFGADYDLIKEVAAIGYDSWIEQQMERPITYVGPNVDAVLEAWLELDDEAEEEEVEAVSLFFRSAWWETVLKADDQLRQRVGLALSEIFVISDRSDELFDTGYGLADYYDMLLENAFGNYRDLLMDVTLHPCMGFYLSHLNNPKGNPEINRRPDENYAREIQQLFSIGLYELNPDGTRKIDDSGQFIPTYNNNDIKEFAKVFTGLKGGAFREGFIEEALEQGEQLPEVPFFGAYFGIVDPHEPMVMQQNQHEPGEKFLLRNTTVAANQPGMEDIEEAIDNLFYHPNVGPFLSRLLIQRLVMSNPSPAYVGRVASVFNDNGEGERGDLGAVVKAILMDEEARNCNALANPSGGMLREPIMRYAHMLRAFHVAPLGSAFLSTGIRYQNATGQFPLSAPTVFNFFLPDYQPNGPIMEQNLVAPEFQIHNNSTAIGYVNEVYNWMFEGNILPVYFEDEFNPEVLGFPLGYLNLRYETELAKNPHELMAYLNLVLTHGQLSDSAHNTILDAVEKVPASEAEIRARLAIYLILVAPDYAIIK